MSSFNKVILVGNLTRDPEVRYTASGTAVTEIGLAINRKWFDKQSNSRKEETTFVDITVWGRTAEVAGEYLTTGSNVLVEGRLQLDQWEDKESGQKRSKLKVICEQMTMLGGARQDGQGGGQEPRQQSRGRSGGGGRQKQGGGQRGGQRGRQQAPPEDGFDDVF